MKDIPKSRWFNNWGIDEENAKIIYDYIIKNKPQVIIETGTFEAQATYVMANASNVNDNNCTIYTIDYDGDPTTNLPMHKWKRLSKYRRQNLDKIKKDFPNVKVVFVEGDSREVLQTIFKDYGIDKVDLFFQDSMHYVEGIMSEWKLVEPFIKKNSSVIIDDLKIKEVMDFRDWFKDEYKNQYDYTECNVGHHQFIAYKN